EPHVRMRREESGQQRAAERRLRDTRCVEPERAARDMRQLTDTRDGGANLVERGTHRGIESLAGLGEPHTARRSLDERDSETLLEAAQRLAHRGVAEAKPLAGGAESLRLGDCYERRHSVQLVSHW